METSPQIQTLCDSYLDAPATTVATNDTDNKKMIRHVKPALCNCANGYTEWISRTPPPPTKEKQNLSLVPVKQSTSLCMFAISEKSIRNITVDL